VLTFGRTPGGALTLPSWDDSRADIFAAVSAQAAELGVPDPSAIGIHRLGGNGEAETTLIDWPGLVDETGVQS
jgi:hypothetical protein